MKFIPGLELNERYYREIVAPLLKQFDPNLTYSAVLIGYGSDVLGFDNATSMDHNWGPRMQIFVSKPDSGRTEPIKDYLRKNLPGEFLGFPTHFSEKGLDGTQRMQVWVSGEVNHLIEVYEIDQYFNEVFHKDLAELTNLDWLCISEQKLVELTSGRVFHDGLQRLEKIRSRLSYYPWEVKLIKLAAYWDCISNEEAFVGRAVEFGDLIGAKLISARMVNYLLKICFMLKDKYAPYSKWFTRQFAELDLGEIKKAAVEVLTENELKKIEERLAELYMKVLNLQNKAPDLPKVDKEITSYYQRPYKVIMADDLVKVLLSAITDEQLKQLDLRVVGIDCKIDSNDFTDLPHLERLIKVQ
jgi:hypothetical protein